MARPSVIVAAIVILVCLFSHLGAMGLVGPDEPRYVWIARAMAESGDWVTPRLFGQPWFEKPVLYYWAAAFGFSLHLPAEWAARLPSALAALAAALALGWLAGKHYNTSEEGQQSAVLAAPLIFSTSVAGIGFARGATPDMLFSASLTLAMAVAARDLRRAGALRKRLDQDENASGSDAVSFTVFGALLGLAVLAKGPAGVVLATGAVGLWALISGNWRAAIRLAHPLAVATFFIVASPWYLLCARRNPDFLRVFFLEHNFQRYVTPVFQHRQPFWFFGPMLLLAIFPSTILLVPAAREALNKWRERKLRDSSGMFFACWGIFPVLFFSLSQSKLPGYILPAIAPLALVLAIVWARIENANAAGLRWVTAGFGFTWFAAGLSATYWMRRLPMGARDASGGTIYLCAWLAIAGGIALGLLGLIRLRNALVVSCILVALLVEVAGARVLPSLDHFLSARHHAALLRQDRRPDRLFTFHLSRSWIWGLDFYLERELPQWSPEDPEAALVLTNPKGLEELRRLGRFRGTLEEDYKGILYVPVLPAPR
jgi:4-amino-4-deoxy-L-arabinose transferase-like glycosyltransferase